MSVDSLFSNLNEQQISAVRHFQGPALVVAGPGSGKTRVLTHRVAYLINEKHIPEFNILTVTFTNKAAGEIKSRVNELLPEKTNISWSGTFHSICSRILRKHGPRAGISPSFVIYDTDDQLTLIKSIIKDFGIDKKRFNPHAILGAISSAKSELVASTMYQEYAQGYFQKTIAKIYPEYQKRLRRNNALDFDDLLVETVRLFDTDPQVLNHYQNQFQYLLVDEYQDTNKAQYVLTKQLSNSHGNLFVVGDMAQAIYSFRGADYRNILNFQKDYPKASIYNLERNYRSTQNILDAAKSVINNNSTHIPLDLWTDNKGGSKLIYFTGGTDRDEASYIVGEIDNHILSGKKFKDVAVLYRTNAQSRNIEEHLIKANIPYKIVGGVRFYSRKEIKDVVSYLRVIHNPKDTVSWKRIINVPTRGMGKKTIESIEKTEWDLDFIEEKAKIPIKKWIELSDSLSTLELMDKVLDDTGYIKWLNDGSEENFQRIENIKELRTVADQFTELSSFLENVSLIESSDKPNSDLYEVVTLMTVHASKGLEFPVVFMIGMEEGLFPHTQSLGELSGLEEERRLCYVAMTRAMENIYLTNAKSRMYFGIKQSNLPSRFLFEIPKDLIDFKGVQGLSFNNFSFGKNLGSNNDGFLDDLEYDRLNFDWE